MLAADLHDVPPGHVACVVTTLARPAATLPAAIPDPPGVALRSWLAPDPSAYRALFRRVGAPWLWRSRLALPDEALAALLGHSDIAVSVPERNGRSIGLLELDFRTPGIAEIAFFGLEPEATGRGLGRWMMGRALALAAARPIETVTVHTCTLDHPAALPFYRAHGFVPVRRQVEVMPDPRREGLLPPDCAPEVPAL